MAAGRRSALLAGVLAAGLAVTACGAAHGHPGAAAAKANVADTSGGAGSGSSSSSPGAAAGSGDSGSAAGGSGGSGQAASAKPLAGKTIGIDPGHNGHNKDDPGYINKLVWNGREKETCDTTGTESNSGYTEARFNFNVATYLRADLRKDGARVVMTRSNNHGVGPCVNRRARILNRAHANVSIDIHADGGPANGRGFTVLEPLADGPNNKVIKSSDRFGADAHRALLKHTSMPISNYYGHNGYIKRDDLAGLNLTTQAKILIECGNMRNSTDARLLRATWFQKRLAKAFASAIVWYETHKR
ncbi:MAG TPA: N-acetylmuramoyl-L-alanine amidase [Streptosporangiaceae bacterium]|jgi:N-acetylmuramoyl-L-alanine amidase